MLGIRAVYRRCIVFIGRRVLLICYIIFHNITLSVLNTVCTGGATGWLVTFPLRTGVCLSLSPSRASRRPRCLLLRWDAQPLQTVYCCAHSSIRRGRSRLHLERKEVAQLLPSVDDEVLEKHLGVWGWQPDTVRRALH